VNTAWARIRSEFNKQSKSNSIVLEGVAVSFWQQTSAVESKWCNCYWLSGGSGWSLGSFVHGTRFPETKECNWYQSILDSARSSEVPYL